MEHEHGSSNFSFSHSSDHDYYPAHKRRQEKQDDYYRRDDKYRYSSRPPRSVDDRRYYDYDSHLRHDEQRKSRRAPAVYDPDERLYSDYER